MTESLWTDEAFYSLAQLGGDGWRQIALHDVHPPAYPLLMRAWIALAGETEIALRLPSLLMGLSSLLLVWAWARIVVGRWGAVGALSFLVLSPVHVWYSHENKANMMLFFSVALLLFGTARFWERGDRISLLGVWLGALLALGSHGFALWPVAAVFVWLWLGRHRNPDRWRATLPLLGGVALLYVPFAAWKAIELFPSYKAYLRPFRPAELYALLIVYLPHGNSLRTVLPGKSPWPTSATEMALDALVFFVLAWSIVLAARRAAPGTAGAHPTDADHHRLLLLVLLLPLVALLALSALGMSIYIERNLIFLLAPYAVLIGSAAASLPSRTGRGLALALLLLFGGISLYTQQFVKSDDWTVYKPKEDWRTAASYLKTAIRRSGRDHLVYVMGRKAALSYYGLQSEPRSHRPRGRRRRGGRVLKVVQLPPAARISLRIRVRGKAPFWVIGSVRDRGLARNIADLSRQPGLDLMATKRFPALELFRYEWSDPAGGVGRRRAPVPVQE